MKKKWIWITVPAVAVGLTAIFIGGAVFAQESGNSDAASPNWTAMYEYCRTFFTGNVTPDKTNATGPGGYCGGGAGPDGPAQGGMMGGGMWRGMMGNGSFDRGMMSW